MKFYTSGFDYTEKYEAAAIRGIDENRPWQLENIIRQYLSDTQLLLDIGAGTASKLTPLSNAANHLIALEPNSRMLAQAQKNLSEKKINNIHLIAGLAQNLPFYDNSFDIVTNMLAPYDFAEAYRVLKPKGKLIEEKLGERDKYELKLLFGEDEKGLRGQLIHLPDNFIIDDCHKKLSGLFSKFSIQTGIWPTYYSIEGLTALLENTPSVRNFNRFHDQKTFEQACRLLMTDKGIRILQHRILIIAEK